MREKKQWRKKSLRNSAQNARTWWKAEKPVSSPTNNNLRLVWKRRKKKHFHIEYLYIRKKCKQKDGKPHGVRQYAQAVSVKGCILFSAVKWWFALFYSFDLVDLVYLSLSMKLQQPMVSTVQGSFSVIQVKFLSNLVQKYAVKRLAATNEIPACQASHPLCIIGMANTTAKTIIWNLVGWKYCR